MHFTIQSMVRTGANSGHARKSRLSIFLVLNSEAHLVACDAEDRTLARNHDDFA